MTLAFLSLGHGSKTGSAGIDETVLFKRQLRAVLPFPDGAYVCVSPNPETHRCEARAVYERSIPGAKEWAEKAAEVAPSVWASLAGRRRERERV